MGYVLYVYLSLSLSISLYIYIYIYIYCVHIYHVYIYIYIYIYIYSVCALAYQDLPSKDYNIMINYVVSSSNKQAALRMCRFFVKKPA